MEKKEVMLEQVKDLKKIWEDVSAEVTRGLDDLKETLEALEEEVKRNC